MFTTIWHHPFLVSDHGLSFLILFYAWLIFKLQVTTSKFNCAVALLGLATFWGPALWLVCMSPHPIQRLILVVFRNLITSLVLAACLYSEQLITFVLLWTAPPPFLFLPLKVINWIVLVVPGYFSYFMGFMLYLCLLSFVNSSVYQSPTRFLVFFLNKIIFSNFSFLCSFTRLIDAHFFPWPSHAVTLMRAPIIWGQMSTDSKNKILIYLETEL